ncbi:MAG: hypothetical protein RLY85_978 [Bacteroidota bacterium]|jgi:uncharacterized protein YbbC (DUF1343 family)
MRIPFLLTLMVCMSFSAIAQLHGASVKPGAEHTAQYIPLLKGKRVGLFANQTSVAGNMHLVDLLLKQGVQVKVIFGPEHGFRGTADAGEKVGNYTDAQTGIPVVSLYGAKRQPSREDLQEVDILIFDIQDVGVRFYTFISSLEAFMESAFLHGKPLLVLDRPNPNIHYVDGPVLDTAYRSFVGMQPVPVVYGMTIGEYAQMLVGEKWLKPAAMQAYTALQAKGVEPLKVIPCLNYTRQTPYELPVKPSPNLPDNAAIYWYPSTCFFEGTVLSEGRGTAKPFQYFGHPQLPNAMFSFTPVAMPGAMNPKLKDQLCYGWDLSGTSQEVWRKVGGRLQLSYLLEAYRLFPAKDQFFILPRSGDAKASFFNKLAGNAELMEQVKSGLSEQEIRLSWEPGLAAFQKIRAKYLIYR